MNISHSRLLMYQACPRLYYWRFVQNLVPTKDAVPLIVGKAVHAGLAALYAKRKPKEQTKHAHSVFEETRKSTAWLPDERQHLDDQEVYVAYILAMYLKHWGDKEPWVVLAPEVEGDIPLGDHRFFFRSDLLISWKGHPFLLDHKTTSQLGNMFFSKFRMDGQITMYCYCIWKKLDMRPVGAIINAICKSRKLDRVTFARDVVMRSEKQLTDYVLQVEHQLDMLWSLSRIAPNRKEDWIMHTSNCVSYNRMCDYVDLCSSDKPAMRELFAMRVPDYVDEGGKQ